jgi:hypothetical protein
VSGSEEPLSARFELRRAGHVIAVRDFASVPGDCEDLKAALSFAIALAIDGVVSPPPPPDRPAARATPRQEAALSAWLETQATFFDTAGVAGGAALGIAWSIASLELGLGAVGALPHSVAVAEGSAKSWRAGARAYACGEAVGQSWVPKLCLLTSGGALFSRGEGFAEERSAAGPWLTAALRASLLWRASDRVAFGPSLDGEARLVRPELVLRSRAGMPLATASSGAWGAAVALTLESSF